MDALALAQGWINGDKDDVLEELNLATPFEAILAVEDMKEFLTHEDVSDLFERIEREANVFDDEFAD